MCLAQSGYNYTYTDPCTLVSSSIFVPSSSGVAVSYFGNTNTFTSSDFQSGAFDSWIDQVTQVNSSSPCESITTSIVNNITTNVTMNSVAIATTITSITTTIAESLNSTANSVAGFTSTVESISNTNTPKSEQQKGKTSGTNPQTNTGSTGTSQPSNESPTNQTPATTDGGTPTQPSTGSGQQQGETPSTDQPAQSGSTTTESTVNTNTTSESGLANSISNVAESGGSSGSTKANKTSASMIASGDIVAIANTDQSQNFKFVGSITHANTKGTRIKGILFNYTSGDNNINLTLYKSWINKSRKLNTVAANSIMVDFDKNYFNTLTVLQSYKFSKKSTAMFGLNGTIGKMGERALFNLSTIGGATSSFQINKRLSTSILVLGVYSPFTQFYAGQWWKAGILVVPFSSWDIKLTKTFKYNISVTGVYQFDQTFLNYQVLTGGKLTF